MSKIWDDSPAVQQVLRQITKKITLFTADFNNAAYPEFDKISMLLIIIHSNFDLRVHRRGWFRAFEMVMTCRKEKKETHYK